MQGEIGNAAGRVPSLPERGKQKHEGIVCSIESLDYSIDSLDRLMQKVEGTESNVKELSDTETPPIPPLSSVLADTSAHILERRDRIDEIVARLENILF